METTRKVEQSQNQAKCRHPVAGPQSFRRTRMPHMTERGQATCEQTTNADAAGAGQRPSNEGLLLVKRTQLTHLP
jgi:hypothetical protein